MLAAAGVLLVFAAAREISLQGGLGKVLGERAGEVLRRRTRALATGALLRGVPERLRRAGLAGRVSPTAVLAAKFACTGIGLAGGMAAAPAAPGRLAWLVLVAMPAAGFVGPEALLEHRSRRRREQLVAALPDALDLLAVSSASGRSATAGFADIAALEGGPLAAELAVTVAEVSAGMSQGRSLAALRERVSGSEIAALIAAIERSRRYGSPLADQLRRQAGALRRDRHRLVEERAARAAPKIQLVVALVLVPSVLLMIAAGLIANGDALLGGF
jgi:tight adherence protein C